VYTDPTWNDEEDQPGEWSLSGFDEPYDNRDVVAATTAAAGTVGSSSGIDGPSITPPPVTRYSNQQMQSAEDDEGIFDLDL
jgi:hypothetical protein